MKQVEKARREQRSAWERWQNSDSAEDMAAWERAVEAQKRAEDQAADAADRWEAWEADRENRQANWWDAAKWNARMR